MHCTKLVDSLDEVVVLKDVSWLPFELFYISCGFKCSMIPICILRNSSTKHYQVLRICFDKGELTVLAEFTFNGSVQGVV